MATDTLEIFGQEYTNVAGFKATDDNDQIKTYIRPQGTISISQNGQGIDVSQYASADVAVPSTDFIVTVSYNSTTQMWEPDKTFAEIQTAYTAGKTIAVNTTEDSDDVTADGEMLSGVFYYAVREIHRESFHGESRYVVTESYYDFTANGVSLDDDQKYVKPSSNLSITQNGTGIDVAAYASVDVAVPSSSPTIQSLTVTPTTSQQTFNASGVDGYKPVTVNAMPSGSATAPATISGTSATVSTGTNTLTLSKTVSVTPTVSAGYVSSGTAGNSSVSLQASVTTKAAATIRASTSQQTIASGTYLTGTQTIAPVSQTNLSAENIKAGTTISISNGSTNLWSVTGTYTGGSSKNIQAYWGRSQRTANSYGATDLTITVSKAGTYNVYWTAWRGSSSGTMGTNLYRNGTAGTNQQTWTGTYGQNITLTNQTYNQGDVLTLYATSGSTTRSIYVANLVIVEQ